MGKSTMQFALKKTLTRTLLSDPETANSLLYFLIDQSSNRSISKKYMFLSVDSKTILNSEILSHKLAPKQVFWNQVHIHVQVFV